MTPAPVSIVDRETFCLMDLSHVGYVISICEYDERGKVVLRPDFRGQRLNLYFRDLTDGVGIATEADIEKTCKFSAKWALAARKDPEKAPLVVHCAAGISRSTAIAMIPLIAYYESAYQGSAQIDVKISSKDCHQRRNGSSNPLCRYVSPAPPLYNENERHYVTYSVDEMVSI